MREFYLISWLIGTAALFLIAVVWGFRLILVKKRWFGLVLILIGIVAIFFNPIANFFFTNDWNHQRCEAALEKARFTDYTGVQSDEIKKQFGQPYRVQRGKDGAEYWGYRTCPWWVFNPDEFLGFEIKDGKVEKLFLEVD